MLPATRKKSFVQHRAKDKVRANSRNKLGWIIIFTPYINIKKLVRDIRLQRLPKDVFPNEIPKFSKFRSSNLGGVENPPKKNKKKKKKKNLPNAQNWCPPPHGRQTVWIVPKRLCSRFPARVHEKGVPFTRRSEKRRVNEQRLADKEWEKKIERKREEMVFD